GARCRRARSMPINGSAVLDRGNDGCQRDVLIVRTNAAKKQNGNAVMRLPFFYGWWIVVVTFVTMAIGVNARTAFSLFFPPIISEFGWERGVTAGAFSFGFVVSGIVIPLID